MNWSVWPRDYKIVLTIISFSGNLCFCILIWKMRRGISSQSATMCFLTMINSWNYLGNSFYCRIMIKFKVLQGPYAILDFVPFKRWIIYRKGCGVTDSIYTYLLRFANERISCYLQISQFRAGGTSWRLPQAIANICSVRRTEDLEQTVSSWISHL